MDSTADAAQALLLPSSSSRRPLAGIDPNVRKLKTDKLLGSEVIVASTTRAAHEDQGTAGHSSINLLPPNVICTLPTTDRVGALQSLAPEAWLSATCIEIVLNTIRPMHCRVIDNTLIPSIQDLDTLLSRPLLQLGIETQLWVVIHHRAHWIMVVVDLESGKVDVFDPLQGHIPHREVSTIVQAFLAYLHKHDKCCDLSWKVSSLNVCQQSNTFDCGLCILVIALCLVGQHPFPTKVHSLCWRQAFRWLLDPTQVALWPLDWQSLESSAPALPPSLGLEDINAVHKLYKESYESLDNAKDDLQCIQVCYNVLAAASRVIYPQRESVLTASAQHCQEYEAEVTIYESLLATLRSSTTQLRRSSVLREIQQGREEAVMEVERCKEVQGDLNALLESWTAAEASCKTVYEHMVMIHQRAIDSLGECMGRMEGAKKVLNDALTQTESLIESGRAIHA